MIGKWILETETLSQKVMNSLDILYAKRDTPPDKKNSEMEELLRNFNFATDVVKMMIHFLLLEIYTKIKSDEDKLTLSVRTINVLVKTLKHVVYPSPPLTLLELFGYSNLKVSEATKDFGKGLAYKKNILNI